jgi:hypothetical protein
MSDIASVWAAVLPMVPGERAAASLAVWPER